MKDSKRLQAGVMAAIALLAIVKIYLGASLELFQDEVFYWMESQRLAPSYSDIPPLTAYAIRLGTGLFGDNVLGVRALFLAAGILTPFFVFWLARPIVGHRDAWLAAGCSLLMPLMVVVGPVAVADSLLVAISVLFMACFERATRTGQARFWWLSGLLLALGFLCHYRFATLALGGVVYLLFTARGRCRLRTTGPWLAAVLAVLGLLPVLWFSFSQGHQALQFQLVERHPWSFDIRGLRFIFNQALLTTPLLFAFLIAAWIRLWREARRGDDRSLLLWLLATFASGAYFLLSPFMGQNFPTFHWTLGGYMALLVAMPAALRASRGWLAGATVILAAVLTIASAGILSLQGHMDFLHKKAPGLIFKANTNFTGWEPMAERAKEWLDRLGEEELLLVGEHYITAAQLNFYTGREAYTTEPWKLGSDGRAPQARIWELDEQGLAEQVGHDALVVYMASERGRYSPERHRFTLERLCRMFESVEHIDHLDLWSGIKVYDYYLAKNLGNGPARECAEPMPP